MDKLKVEEPLDKKLLTNEKVKGQDMFKRFGKTKKVKIMKH